MSQTYSLLKQTAKQTVARPYNRAGSTAELVEVLVWGATIEANEHLGFGPARRAAEKAQHEVGPIQKAIKLANIDTETPILVLANGTKFYAFTEE